MKQTALITGASQGIGYELSKVFAENGFNLVLVARSEEKLLKVKDEIENKYDACVYIIAKDLTENDSAIEIFEELNKNKIRTDILVNNAGFGDYGSFLSSDWEKQKNMIRLNIEALMQMTYVFGGEMRKNRYGKILNIASVAAFSSGPYMSVYYASKAFVLSFSQALSQELEASGVTVTALCLAPSKTGFEEAANMRNSHMFKTIKPAAPCKVARCGFEALMKGKSIKYFGMPTKLMSLGSRLSTKAFASKFAKYVNGTP